MIMLLRQRIVNLRVKLPSFGAMFLSSDSSAAASPPALKKTCLHDFHLKRGAKMVEFAGYSMPLQYKESIIDSHNHCRSKAGLFDVSHMLQMHIRGKDRTTLLERLIVADVKRMKENQANLSLFTNENGGILDDLIVTRLSPEHAYYIVSNAGCADKILAHLKTWLDHFQAQGYDVRMEIVENGLLALQGPSMAKVLQPGLDFSLDTLKFMHGQYASVFGIPHCRITRCGYTGEDGVEISVPPKHAEELADKLLSHPDVLPIGLGARDTLRLEAGLCLYGNDIDETTTPVEASLSWTVSKSRLSDQRGEKFLGQDIIAEQMKKRSSVKRRRIGILSSSGPPGRAGAKIFDGEGSEIGVVTSGCISPSLRSNISMGYVPPAFVKAGTQLQMEVRKKKYSGVVVKMPFMTCNYFAG